MPLPTAIAFAAVAMAMLFPTSMFGAPNLANTAFALAMVCGLVMIGRQPRAQLRSFARFIREHWPICLAFAALPLAVAVHDLCAGELPVVPYTYKRIGLFILLAWTFIQVPHGWLARIRWGWLAGVTIAAVWLARVLVDDPRPVHVGLNNLIPFGDLSLLMGVLALLSIGWHRTRVWTAFAVLAALCGLYVSFASGDRGSWLALPIFAGLTLFLPRHLSRRFRLMLCLVAVGTAVGVGASSHAMMSRITSAGVELAQFEQGQNLDSSVGTRLQLWQASWRIFKDHPLTGVGLLGFKPALREEAAQDRLTAAASTFDHSHNEALFALASLGIVGLLAWLSLLLVPACFFARRLRASSLQVRTSAVMGLAICCGFAVYGLTEVLTIIALTNAFYTMTSAALVADILQHEAHYREHQGVPA